jgi:hypothetical protein
VSAYQACALYAATWAATSKITGDNGAALGHGIAALTFIGFLIYASTKAKE